MIARIFSGLWWSLAFAFGLGCALWAVGALYFDFPWPGGRAIASTLLALAFVAALALLKGKWRKLAGLYGGFLAVLAWWFTQQPRHDRPWQPDVAELGFAEIKGDEITLHNVRNCDYRTKTDFTAHWETRKVRLSQLTGIDLFINYWGSPYMAHPLVSFQFADAPPVCFSIETRREIGEDYSPIGGLYRQFELIVIAADERDVVRLRTNISKNEDVYLYRLKISHEKARERFLEYLTTMNELRERPRWYNAITTNCTTAIRSQHPASQRLPWDWRILVNGKADEMFYEKNYFLTDGLPFAELRDKALINTAALAGGDSPDFSRLIREGRPGFAPLPGPTQPASE